MPDDSQPVLVAYDGSTIAQRAVETAARLFGGHRLVVVSVWEPGLAFTLAPTPDIGGVGYIPPSADEMATMDRAQRDHAADSAEAGARLAREHGATAVEPLPVADEGKIGETLADLAEQLDASAIVVGSRGLGAVKSGLFGSTSRELLNRSRRPVLVVKSPDS
jgi:nucleotide-binding universal stress UspA family protein